MKTLVDHIDQKEGEMLEFLKKIVNIDSGTYDKIGVDQVGNVLAERLAALDFSVERSSRKGKGHRPLPGILA